MSDNLINLQNSRISKLEKELEKERHKLDDLIKSTRSKGLKTMRWEIEKTSNGWNLIYPSGFENNGLSSLKICFLIMEPFYRKCQFRNQAFELYDRNTTMKFQDYRNFTEYLKLSKKEKEKLKEDKRDPKSVRKNTEKKLKSGRMSRNDKVQKNVPKIDTRIFDRNY